MNNKIKWKSIAKELLALAPGAILLFDPDYKIIDVNNLFCQTLKKDKKLLIGQEVKNLFPELNLEDMATSKEPEEKNVYVYGQRFVVEHKRNISSKNKFTGGYLTLLTQEEEKVKTPIQPNALPEARLAIWVTQIEERKRIAGKIHNSLGQILYGFKMEFAKKGNALPEETQTYFNKLLDEAINETKFISFELMPAMLEDFGLEATLEELVNKTRNSQFNITYHVSGLTGRLEPNLEILIFSLTQELVNNIIKHAQATQASIYLELLNDLIILKILDNGVGFEKGKLIYAGQSTGLRNIKNSLKVFEGEMKISSQIGKGSLVTIQLPLVLPKGVV